MFTYDNNDTQYLDLYGGHAVISVGHSHPHYVNAIKEQAEKLVFYSNSVINGLQQNLPTSSERYLDMTIMRCSL